ncbi:MAG: hypothetical protein ACE5DL_02475 [Nitrosopumilaceae archaeon]
MFFLVLFSVTVIFLTSSNILVFAQDDDQLKELAEFHVKQAKHLEEKARNLTFHGDYELATKEYEKSAEQYNEAVAYYELLHDFFNAAEYNGRASMAHKEAAIVHSLLNNLELEITNWLLSNQFKAKSLNQKGIFLFGENYILPPKYQQFIVDNPNDIICKPGLELIFKASNYSPACVKPPSISKLIERGWAIS